MGRRDRFRAALGALLCTVVFHGSAAAADADSYLRGYVTALLEREEDAPDVLLGVSDGVVLLDDGAAGLDRGAIEGRIAGVAGVGAVEWVSHGDTRLTAGSAASETTSRTPRLAAPALVEWLPRSSLFEPLLADPRWPSFSASRQRYASDPEFRTLGAVTLGGSLPMLQAAAPFEGHWDVAIQGAVFSVFDLRGPSLDLVNSDFFAALPLSARWSRFSVMLRPYHQSSHLGDEYLLRTQVPRLDVHVEGVDLLASFEIGRWARVYGGGGLLMNSEPADLDRRSLQAGIELQSPIVWLGRLRPLAALDLQRRGENGWSTDYSARLGLQLENGPIWHGRRLQLYAEYFKGFSPNGQFFRRRIEYLGGGLSFYF